MSWEQIEALGEMSSTDVTNYSQSVFRPDNATLVIVGNVDASKAISAARTYFAGWKNPAVPATKDTTLPPPNAPLAGKVIVLDDSKSTQTNISATCALRPHSPETRAHYELVGDVLDKRAWTALRETSGATYGAGGRTVLYDGGSAYLRLNSLVQNDATALAVGTFQRLAKDAEAGRFDATAFAVHKLQLARKYGIYQQSTDQMFARLTDNLNEPWQNLLDYGAQLAGTQLGDMQAAMGSCSANMVVTVEGPKQVVTAKLDEAGIAYEVFDWKTRGDEMLLKYDPAGYKKLMKDRAKEEAKKMKK
jgi:predicted Zn-dependent peptidase